MRMIQDAFSAAIVISALLVIYALVPTWYYLYLRKPAIGCSEDGKKICLSFDDGPDPEYTERLLRILADYKVRAAFFVVAKKAAQNPEIIRRICEGGHLVGLHSLEHRDAWRNSIVYQAKDFKQALHILHKLGCKVTYYRAPWGHLNLTSMLLARKYKLRIIQWSVMAQDWEAASSSSRVFERLTSQTKGGSIICLHDSGCGKRAAPGAPEGTLKAVSEFIPLMLQNGYRFVLPDECLENTMKRNFKI